MCPGCQGLFILKQNLTQYILKLNIIIFDYMMRLMKLNLQIIKKKMMKLNKLRYFDVSFRYSRASWGVLGCLGVSWGNKTDRVSQFDFDIIL